MGTGGRRGEVDGQTRTEDLGRGMEASSDERGRGRGLEPQGPRWCVVGGLGSEAGHLQDTR